MSNNQTRKKVNLKQRQGSVLPKQSKNLDLTTVDYLQSKTNRDGKTLKDVATGISAPGGIKLPKRLLGDETAKDGQKNKDASPND